MTLEIEIPKELAALNPELSKSVILVGRKAFEIYPLYEGQLESISVDLEKIYDAIFNPDSKCPVCGKVVAWAVARKIFECATDGVALQSMGQSPIAAILSSSKIPKWVEMITGIPEAEVKANITLPQIKHFAGIFYKQNFEDDSLPGETKENFGRLLAKIIPKKKEAEGAPEKKPKSPAAETPLQA
jgi:hypothetical protein